VCVGEAEGVDFRFTILRQAQDEFYGLRFTILRQARKLLSIMRPMLIAGELYNEELVCNECGVGGIGKVGHLD